MLQQTIPSYLYQQYADDDDLQAFVAAYNEATQVYVDWFANIGLPYYQGLTGDLLTWVIQGLYGLPKTAIQSSSNTAQGPLNTLALNTQPLDFFLPGSQTVFALDDDTYQRILTWDFYKGDGKRFCMRWLKRRVMRFLVGTHGTDPQPIDPGFVVGAENTEAIGAVIASGECTVTIHQTVLKALTPLKPGIIQFFQTAFEAGALELPAQYSYSVSIV